MDQSELTKVLAAQNDNLKKLLDDSRGTRARLLELEQKATVRGSRTGGDGGDDMQLSRTLMESDGLKSFLAGNTQSCNISVPSNMLTKAQIINATGQNHPLVAAERQQRIVFAPPQRLLVAALFNKVPTSSNAIEFTVEASFTNNASAQGSASPIGNGESELKNESGMTFTLTNVPVRTIAHWIPASRQVLADAPLLESHLSNRLIYGLNLVIENQMVTGDGGAGKLSGLTTNSTAFTGGVTNATAIDTLARAVSQLAIGNFEPSGIILNPADWLALQLLKDTTGRYLVGDPQAGTTPQLFGLPVIPTSSMTAGYFIVLDAQRAGYIAMREEANVRISESHSDHFVRNMVAILAEARLALVIENASAVIYGTTGNVG